MLPSLMKYVLFLYGLRHLLITTAHNWSKTATSSWRNQFKTFNEDKPKTLVWLSLIKLVQWSSQFDVHKFSSYHTLYWMNLTTGWLVPGLLLWLVILREINQCLNHQFILLVIFSLLFSKRFCLNSIILSWTVSCSHKAWTNPPRKRS